MNSHQRKKHRTKMVAELVSVIDKMTDKDMAEILKRNIFLEKQLSRFENRTRSKYKLTEHGGNWFHLVPADEHAAAYLDKQERVDWA